MKIEVELRDAAVRSCPYAPRYNGHAPWVEGYIAAASWYESQLADQEKRLELLRETIRKSANRP